MHTSRDHSPQDALYRSSLKSADHHLVPLQNLNIPLLELYHERGSPSVAFHNPIEFESEFTFDTPQAMRGSDNCRATHADQSSGNLVMGEAPATAPLQFDVTDFWGDVIPSTEMQVEHSGVSTVLQDDGPHELTSATQLSRVSSAHVSSIDLSRYFDFSPSMRSSSGAPALASRSQRSPLRPLSTIRGRIKRSDNMIRASHERQRSKSITLQQSDGPVTFFAFDGMDPESIMLPLQLLRTHLTESLELESLWRGRYSCGSTLNHLYSTLSSSWLSLEMEDLICRSYELSAQAIRRRQAARPVSRDGICLLSTPEDDRECEGPKTARQPMEHGNPETDLRLQLTSRIRRSTSMGRLIVEFSTPPQDSPYVDTSDVLCVINISFIPERQQRTIGISATFRKHSSASQSCRIPPRLRTFNVIPYDSQIIDCIRDNDILGVQRLFTEGKASPLDVDSDGFSLLSVLSPNTAPETKSANFQLGMPRHIKALIYFVYFWRVEQVRKTATCKRCNP